MNAQISLISKSSTKLWLTLILSSTVVSCLDGPKPFKQEGEGADSYVPTAADSGNVTGSFSASSVATQVLQVQSIDNLTGTSLAIPAGSLTKNAKISITEGSSIVHSGSLSSLNVAGKAGGPAVFLKSSNAQNTASAMSLQIPISSNSSLALADARDFDKIVVIFKAQDSDAGLTKLGIIPRSDLKIIDGKMVELKTTRFGSYQVAFLETALTKPIEIKTEEPILAKAEEVVKSVVIQPMLKKVVVGEAYRIIAVALFNDASKRDVSADVAWSSASNAILQYRSSNEFRAVAAGRVDVRAQFKGKTDSLGVTVYPAEQGAGGGAAGTPPVVVVSMASGQASVSGVGTLASPYIYGVDEDTTATITLAGTDAEGDALTYSCIGLPPYASVNSTSGAITVATVNANNGASDDFKCRADTLSNGQYSASIYFHTNANPINDAPTITLGGGHVDVSAISGAGTIGSPYTLTVPAPVSRAAKIAINVADEDNTSGALSVSCPTKPAWASVSGTSPNFFIELIPTYANLASTGQSLQCKVYDGVSYSGLLYFTIKPVEFDDHVIFLADASNGQLGGLGGADDHCRANAAGAFAGMNFKAVLVGDYQTLADRLSITGKIYTADTFGPSLTNVVVADDFNDFRDNSFDSGLTKTTSGATVSSTRIYTGLSFEGSVADKQMASYTCGNWSSNASTDKGSYVNKNVMTNTLSSGSASLCNTAGALMCVSQKGARNLNEFYAVSNSTGNITITYVLSSLGDIQSLKVFAQLGATPPACGTGTEVLTRQRNASEIIIGAPQSYVVAGLTAGASYSFSACVLDSFGTMTRVNVIKDVLAVPAVNVAFASTTLQTGGAGVAAMDAICQTDASSSTNPYVAGSSAGFKAAVSTATIPAFDRIRLHYMPVRDAGFASTYTAANFSNNFWSLASYALKDPSGGTHASNASAPLWAGTSKGGLASVNNCSNWTSSLIGNSGDTVSLSAASLYPGSLSSSTCNTPGRVLCIGRVPIQ